MTVSRGAQCIFVIVPFLILAVIAYTLRIYTRFVIRRNAGPEDYCLGVALIFSIGFSMLIGERVKYGLGQHIWTLNEEARTISLKLFWASGWVYSLSLSFTKVTLLLQYLRLFPIRKFRIACWALLGVVILFGTWTLFSFLFLCYPVAFIWDPSIKGGKCMNRLAVAYTAASLNILTDFAIIILPIPVIKRLALPKRQARAIMFVFALGAFGCIVSILRLRVLVTINISKDITWHGSTSATWSSIESSVGVTCASLTVLKPLISHHFPRPLRSTEGGGRSFLRASWLKGLRKLTIHESARSTSTSANQANNIADPIELTALGSHAHASAEHSPACSNADKDRGIRVATTIQQTIEKNALPTRPQLAHVNSLNQWHGYDLNEQDVYADDSSERAICRDV